MTSTRCKLQAVVQENHPVEFYLNMVFLTGFCAIMDFVFFTSWWDTHWPGHHVKEKNWFLPPKKYLYILNSFRFFFNLKVWNAQYRKKQNTWKKYNYLKLTSSLWEGTKLTILQSFVTAQQQLPDHNDPNACKIHAIYNHLWKVILSYMH